MGEKRFQKPVREYQRTRVKAATEVAVRELYDDVEYYDPKIESTQVAGGDPGLAMLMAEAVEHLLAEQEEKETG